MESKHHLRRNGYKFFPWQTGTKTVVTNDAAVSWTDNEFNPCKSAGPDGVFPGLLSRLDVIGIRIPLAWHWDTFCQLEDLPK